MTQKTTTMTRRKLLTRLSMTAAVIVVAPELAETGAAEAGSWRHKRSYKSRYKKYSHHSRYKKKRWSYRRRSCKPKPADPDTIPE